MMHDVLHLDLIFLMKRVGTLERNQIIRFFSDAYPENRIVKILDALVLNHFFKYDESKDRYSYHSTPELIPDLVDRKILAFWPIASMGSKNVITINMLEYPSQFLVNTRINDDGKEHEDVVYSITVCYSTNEAQVAKALRDSRAIKGVVDNFNYMAVVTADSVGKQLQPYGFDMYCKIDPITKDPAYITFSDT